MTITVFGNPVSTYVRTTLMALKEKGVPFEVDMEGLETPAGLKTEAHLARHPFGRIPVIDDGGFRLYETSAICRYIDEAFDGPSLTPAAPVERALMEQWISAVNCYLYTDMARRFFLQYVFPKGADGGPDRAAIDAALPDLRRDLGLLDAAYGDRDFLAGDAVSIADLFLAPLVFYLAQTPEGPDLLAAHPSVARGKTAMEARTSFVETIPPRM